MSRYPFTDCLKLFLAAEEGHVAKTTYGSMNRRLRQLGTIFKDLKEEGKVSTDNPRKITAKDVDVVVGYRKTDNKAVATIHKDVGYLRKMLLFFDNNAVDEFKIKFPAHYPKRYHKRKESMEEPAVQAILDKAAEVSFLDWKKSEAYAIVVLAITTGLRPKEIQMMYLSNVHIDGDSAEIFAEHVKGEDSYGEPRWVPVHPDGVPMLKKYLEARKFKLDSIGKTSNVLFPPLRNPDGFLSYNYVEKLKLFVEKEVGVKFELRKCRRTYGQRAVDEGQDLRDVSRVLGHTTVNTTKKHYCDVDQHSVARKMAEKWQNNNANVTSEDA